MKTLEATPLTPTSWILTEWGNRIGVLSCENAVWCVLGKALRAEAPSLELLCSAQSWSIKFQDNKETDEKPQDRIGSLPVRHPNPQNIDEKGRVTYTKTANGKSRHAAGYWAIRFVNGWSGSLCPKAATLDEYEHLGPFTTKLELNTVLNKQNKAR
jgi:hypothetical protein